MASFVMHGALVVVVYLTARETPEDTARSGTPVAPVERVNMVYLPPVPIARPQASEARPVARPAPDAVQAQDDQNALVREPERDLPPALEQQTEPPPAESRREAPRPAETLASRQPPPSAPEQPTLESEAQRIFGRPQLRRQQDNPNQLGVRLGSLSDRNSPARRSCVPKERDPNAPIEMAELVGRVWYDEAHTRPLPGAFLQIIGTAYSAYSDRTGLYRLVFDASLVDECRTQYVRVVAAGYAGRNLVLGLGPGVNDVVMSR